MILVHIFDSNESYPRGVIPRKVVSLLISGPGVPTLEVESGNPPKPVKPLKRVSRQKSVTTVDCKVENYEALSNKI